MGETRKLLYVSTRSCPEPLEQRLLAGQWQIVHARGLKSARTVLRQQRFLVALLVVDSVLPTLEAEFESCVKAAPDCQWVGVFSKVATQAPCLHALTLKHLFDYHTHPADPQFIGYTVGHAFGRALLRRSVEPTAPASPTELGMIGRSPGVVQLRRLIKRAGPTEAPVLIGGESGSGKELVAQALHACSRRAAAPFVTVNCGAIAPTLIHAELFGHERGSFSGASSDRRGLIETAQGGTLFLDEIAELPLDLQATLLRFLQEKTFQRVGGVKTLVADVRVVAASHVDLGRAVAAGRFRQDLFYRLNVLPLIVPPLRDRRDDIPLLTQYFYERCSRQGSSEVRGLSGAAMAALMHHDWPGNVRELFNRVQRAVVLAEGPMILPTDLGLASVLRDDGSNLQTIRMQAEKSAIALTLDRVCHNVTMAALDLGVSRMTLYRLMAKHSITPGIAPIQVAPPRQQAPAIRRSRPALPEPHGDSQIDL